MVSCREPWGFTTQQSKRNAYRIGSPGPLRSAMQYCQCPQVCWCRSWQALTCHILKVNLQALSCNTFKVNMIIQSDGCNSYTIACCQCLDTLKLLQHQLTVASSQHAAYTQWNPMLPHCSSLNPFAIAVLRRQVKSLDVCVPFVSTKSAYIHVQHQPLPSN